MFKGSPIYLNVNKFLVLVPSSVSKVIDMYHMLEVDVWEVIYKYRFGARQFEQKIKLLNL